MVFSGTAAVYGRGRAVVTATGMQTEMGKIAGLLVNTTTRPRRSNRNWIGPANGWAFMVLVIAVVMVITILLVEDVRGPRRSSRC